MSSRRIALVAEGATDVVVIEAALKAILVEPFILTVLQPEATRPSVGGGWCGVFKWCRDFAARSSDSLETDPTLPGFDLFIVHIDADVAGFADGNCGLDIALQSVNLPPLPCPQPCPPATAAADEVRQRVLAWLGLSQVGPHTVLCVPSKAIDAWMATAVLPATHAVLAGVECNLRLEAHLGALTKSARIRKRRTDYQRHAVTVTSNWRDVCAICTQAARFETDIQMAI